MVSIQDGASLTEYLTYFASQPQSDNVHVAFRFSANLNLSQSNLVKRFFTNFGPQMKSLDAFVNYRTRFELAQFAFILKKLTKLEELRLHLNKKDNDRNLNSDGIALKKLRKLILHYKSDFPWETTDIVEHFLLSRNFFPALETIELPPFSVRRQDGSQRRLTGKICIYMCIIHTYMNMQYFPLLYTLRTSIIACITR